MIKDYLVRFGVDGNGGIFRPVWMDWVEDDEVSLDLRVLSPQRARALRVSHFISECDSPEIKLQIKFLNLPLAPFQKSSKEFCSRSEKLSNT